MSGRVTQQACGLARLVRAVILPAYGACMALPPASVLVPDKPGLASQQGPRGHVILRLQGALHGSAQQDGVV